MSQVLDGPILGHGPRRPRARGAFGSATQWHNGVAPPIGAANNTSAEKCASTHLDRSDERQPSDRAHLSVDQVEHQHFATNFIRTAVCELRFPTLYELDADKPPAEFAHALRKEYPTHGLAPRVNVSPAALARSNAHVFTSRKGQWTINLTSHTLSLETSRYGSFEDFQARIAQLVSACRSFIDSDFFTRVGIRYINVVPYDRATIAEWINPSPVGNLASGVYGDATEHAQAVRGTTEAGGFLFQHGIGPPDSTRPGYGLDYDFYAENVELKDAMAVVRSLHKREFEMFMWSLGERAKLFLRSAEAGHV
jgi:uncharacterized protein (TIGR04255 family)